MARRLSSILTLRRFGTVNGGRPDRRNIRESHCKSRKRTFAIGLHSLGGSQRSDKMRKSLEAPIELAADRLAYSVAEASRAMTGPH